MRQRREVTTADLVRLAERIWLGGPSDGPVRVSTGDPGPDYDVVQRFAVLPSMQAPRYLVPVGAWRGLMSNAYHAPHRSSAERLLRTTVAGGAAASMAWPRPRLQVAVRRDVPRSEWPEHLLLARIAQELGRDVQAMVPVRREMPTSKPTLRLSGSDGEHIGFAKVGWSQPTNELVDNETEVLRELEGRVGDLATPSVLAAGFIHGNQFLVTDGGRSPLRRWTGDPATLTRLTYDVADSTGIVERDVDDPAHVGRLRASLEAAGGHEAAKQVADLLNVLVDRHAGVSVPIGRWHGDWTPWNVVRSDGHSYAWDWEFSEHSVPLGLDMVHWYFQGALARPQGTLVGALGAADMARPHLAHLGLSAEHWPVVRAWYVLEVLTRACRLYALGSGWNPRVRAGLAAVVARVRADL